MASGVDRAKLGFNLLMSTGKPRFHPHIYFGFPIKIIAIAAASIDVFINVLPALFAPPKYQLLFLVLAFLTRIAALYFVISPKLKFLNGYRVLLLITILISFGICLLQLILSFLEPRNGCHKLFIKHAFDVCGVLTPIEIMVFIAISSYVSFVSEQEESNRNLGPYPSAPSNEPADPNGGEKQQMYKVNEMDERPLINTDPINDLD